MEFKIQSNNKDEVQRSLDNAVKNALDIIGFQVENYARNDVPVDTGNLRNSITHTTETDSVTIGSNVEYAPFVELGTSKMKAQPFLAPSIENHMDEYRNIIQNELQNG